MFALPIIGISVAVAVTAGAATLMQIRNDVRDAGAFEVREQQLVELNRRNFLVSRENAHRAAQERTGREAAEAQAEAALAHSQALAAAQAESRMETLECPAACYSLLWSD